ncbi:MAG: PQQ-dependent sugar dehydrogenase [Bacteroidota bacterium]
MKLTRILLCCHLFILFSCGDDDNDTQENNNPDSVAYAVVNAFPNLSFDRPLDFQSPDDGTDRVFVVEQGGTIQVFQNDATIAETTVFLDIGSSIATTANEQGLLGLAFHPDFETNGYFYINYNPSETLSVISRFTVDDPSSNTANVASEQVLLQIPQPFNNHNGGQLAFGPDGYLYISSGDGGSGGDPQGNAQNLGNLLGTILRIDVDNVDFGLQYGIPTDNPFVDDSGALNEIYAYGLRNPWRMAFDSVTGVLWTGDVGQNEREEINTIVSGGNYGWNFFEGTDCFTGDCDTTGLIAPIYEYDQSNGDRSVTGGVVYRGVVTTSLIGRYIYADFVSGRIWALQTDGGMNQFLVDSNLNISSFGTDQDNELYLCAFDGNIYQLVEIAN